MDDDPKLSLKERLHGLQWDIYQMHLTLRAFRWPLWIIAIAAVLSLFK